MDSIKNSQDTTIEKRKRKYSRYKKGKIKGKLWMKGGQIFTHIHTHGVTHTY
jgi:hypothetical protein